MKEFRGGIIRLFEQGKSGYQIAKDMKLPYTTVRDTIRRYRETTMTDQEVGGRELLVHQLKLEKSRAGSSGIRTVEGILHEKWPKELKFEGVQCIWSKTSYLNASKSTSARSKTMENGHLIRPIYGWRTSHY